MDMLGATERPSATMSYSPPTRSFLTGTSAEIAGVSALDQRVYGKGKLTQELKGWYQDTVHGQKVWPKRLVLMGSVTPCCADVLAAWERIRSHVRQTPLLKMKQEC